MRFGLKLAAIAAVTVAFCSVSVSAAVPYDTYTYENNGDRSASPDAYVPSYAENGSSYGCRLNSPQDLYVDGNGLLFICDTGNNRLLRFDLDNNTVIEFKTFLNGGKADDFNSPTGCCTDRDGNIYIADSNNGRIVILNKNGEYLRQLSRPETDMLDSDILYHPLKVSTDKFNNIYVVAENVTLGVIMYNSNYEFMGFIGAQRVSYNLADYMWKRFMTDEQKSRVESFVPMTFANVACDSEGFVYVINTAIDVDDMVNTINSGNNDGLTTPIKKLNAAGRDVLLRTAAYPPVGDLDLEKDENGNYIISSMTDVAIGEENTYTLLDRKRSRIFTYSNRGDLLFAFGDQNSQVGNNIAPVAVEYRGTDLIVLDQTQAQFTVYKRTEYGDALVKAIALQNQYLFDEAENQWREVLNYCPNSTLAYEGIGQSLLNREEYKSAMAYFEKIDDKKNYSVAFEGNRKKTVEKNLGFIIAALLGAVAAVGFSAFKISKINKEKTNGFKHCFFYAFYIIFHPMEGMWDQKHEKRGSLSAALTVFSLAVLSQLAKSLFIGNIFSQEQTLRDLLQNAAAVLLLAVLFVLANWCLSTLMDGKAKLPDILTVTCYATLPLFISNIITVPLSYFISLNEGMYITFIYSLGVVWTLMLVFCGVMQVQQYSVTKNFATCILSIVGMAVIAFIAMLIFTTLAQIFSFGKVILLELTR